MTRNLPPVRTFFEAFNRGDFEGALKDAPPSFELDLSRAVGPEHGVYGLEEARHLFGRFTDSWDTVRIEAEEYIEAGESVVTPSVMYAKGRDGIEVPSRVTWVWTVRDGAIARACMYQERDEALEAVGAA